MQDKNEIINQAIWQLNLIFATRDVANENVKVGSYLNKKAFVMTEENQNRNQYVT